MSSGCSSRHFADHSGSARSAPCRSSSVASAPSRMTTDRARRCSPSGSGVETAGATQVAAAGEVIAKARIRTFGEADTHALADPPDLAVVAADPELAAAKQVDAVVPAIDAESRRQAARAARDIRDAHVLTSTPHAFDPAQGLECPEQNALARA